MHDLEATSVAEVDHYRVLQVLHSEQGRNLSIHGLFCRVVQVVCLVYPEGYSTAPCTALPWKLN